MTVNRCRYVVGMTVLTAMVCCLEGCGGAKGPKIVVAKATGVVTLKRQPLEAGIVTFESAKTGQSASAPLGTGGKFTIPSIAVGSYDVGISPPPPQEAGDPAVQAEAKSPIPALYQSASTSTLKAEVKAGGSNESKFELN